MVRILIILKVNFVSIKSRFEMFIILKCISLIIFKTWSPSVTLTQTSLALDRRHVATVTRELRHAWLAGKSSEIRNKYNSYNLPLVRRHASTNLTTEANHDLTDL